MRTAALVVATAGLGALTFAFRFMSFVGFTNDHYYHVARAQQMLLGDLPVRDFVDPGMPLMYLTSAAAQWLVSPDLMTEVVLISGLFAISAALTVPLATGLSGSLAIGVMVTLLEILAFPRSYSYPKILLYALAGWALVAVAQIGAARVLVEQGRTARTVDPATGWPCFR